MIYLGSSKFSRLTFPLAKIVISLLPCQTQMGTKELLHDNVIVSSNTAILCSLFPFAKTNAKCARASKNTYKKPYSRIVFAILTLEHYGDG